MSEVLTHIEPPPDPGNPEEAVYNLETWRRAPGSRDELVYRPSVLTLGYRLVVTGLMALALYGLHRLEGMPAYVLWSLAGLCGLVGLLAPLSVAWQRVGIRRDIRNNLEIRSRGVLGWTRTRQWPLSAAANIGLSATEEYAGHRPRRRIGWRWHVTIPSRMPAAGNRVSGARFLIHFWRCMQKDRPSERGPLPAEVAELVDGLEQLTGLSCDRMRVDIGHIRLGGYVTETSRPPVKTTRRTFESLDEVPPELRTRFEEMMAEAQRTGKPQYREVQSARVTYRDSTGQVHTFNSIEEMPPEIRKRYEAMVRRRKRP